MKRITMLVLMFFLVLISYGQETLAKFNSNYMIINEENEYDVASTIHVYKIEGNVFLTETMDLTEELVDLYIVKEEIYEDDIYELMCVGRKGQKVVFLLGNNFAALLLPKGNKVNYEGKFTIKPTHL